MNGGKFEAAPECSDYVGPVEIHLTPDGHGRGLYLTKDAEAGELLLVINPIAEVLNLDSKMDDSQLQSDLFVALVCAASSSSRAFKQLNALAFKHGMNEVPEMGLFKSSDDATQELHSITKKPDYTLDLQRLDNIIKLSSFGMKVCHLVERWVGVWALPALINHSCLPNMVLKWIGQAMFIRAAKNMKAGDELVLSYIECLTPFSYRKKQLSEGWGFECDCRRCRLERSNRRLLKRLESDLPHYYQKDLTKEELIISMGKKCAAVEEAIRKIWPALVEEEANWIRAGFPDGYLSCAANVPYVEAFGNFPDHIELMKLLQSTSPTSHKTMFLVARLLSRLKLDSQEREYTEKVLFEVFRATFGNGVSKEAIIHIANLFVCDTVSVIGNF